MGLAGVLALTVHAAGCGRLGYEILPTGGTGGDAGAEGSPDAAITGPPDPGTDALPPIDGPLPAMDAAPPADSGVPPADTAPVGDMGPPIDTVPDMPAATSCPLATASDMIADFESGSLSTNRVSGRGGPEFHLVDTTAGSLTNVAMTNCGQRAMQVVATSSKAPVVQGPLMYRDASGNTQSFDARMYRGISISLRASRTVAVRLKLPNDDTRSGGTDHFQASLTVGTSFTGASLVWSTFKQPDGVSTQFPSFDVSRLYAVEISASLAVGATLWVDEIAFWR